ncbi:BLOC-1-related complex subunit 6-like [Corvus kubaryi]|uniref:BLOC-1-related complex subunit 6-like n=1 Tax=Corvus kubaryi TaxID=68294 RepID=UPI001C046417|nr:BLOC-1-related complex subunit 6-like [Corvus kubaryi]
MPPGTPHRGGGDRGPSCSPPAGFALLSPFPSGAFSRPPVSVPLRLCARWAQGEETPPAGGRPGAGMLPGTSPCSLPARSRARAPPGPSGAHRSARRAWHNHGQRGQSQSPWDKWAAHDHQLGHTGVPVASLGGGGCSDSPRAVQAGRWQRWDGPRALGRGSSGASDPASAPGAGCPRVNESLLLLQTISDIFADNATLSLCRLPGSTSPAAPAPHAAPAPPPAFATMDGPVVQPAPRPDTAPRHLARRRSAAAAGLQSQVEQPAPLAAL